MQIDNPKRGFSYKVDEFTGSASEPGEKGISAAERLDTISVEELAGMLDENSDEPYCEENCGGYCERNPPGQSDRYYDKTASGD